MHRLDGESLSRSRLCTWSTAYKNSSDRIFLNVLTKKLGMNYEGKETLRTFSIKVKAGLLGKQIEGNCYIRGLW